MEETAENYDVAKYDRPSVTVDIVLFTIKDDDLKVLLIKRGHWPEEGKWALPGGFIKLNESLEQSALRELKEEAGITKVYLEQLYSFGEPKRDPRTRVISVAYFALVDETQLGKVKPSKSKREIADSKWYSMKSIPELAFDHKEILEYALQRLRYKLGYTSVGLELLPKYFTLTELQTMYEIILDEKLDKRNFRKKISSLGILEATQRLKEGAHRPARLYKFKKQGDPRTAFKRVQFEG